MSKYIDERPVEEIIQSTVLDGQHEDFIKTILEMILSDEENNWRFHPFRGDQNFYDMEVFHLMNDKKKLVSEQEQVQKHFDSVFAKVMELSKELNGDGGNSEYAEEEEEEEEDYYDTAQDYYKEKNKASMIRAKPAEIAAKKKKDQISLQQFKATMASLQEELRGFAKVIAELDEKIKENKYYSEVAVKSFRTIRGIIGQYKKNRDVEYVKKGLYFVKKNSDMLMKRYDPDTLAN